MFLFQLFQFIPLAERLGGGGVTQKDGQNRRGVGVQREPGRQRKEEEEEEKRSSCGGGGGAKDPGWQTRFGSETLLVGGHVV